MFEKIKEHAHNALTKGKLAVGSVAALGSAAVLSVASFAAGEGAAAWSNPTISVTSADFAGIMDQINAIFPAILPVIIGCLAFRKGVSFMLRQVRGA